jgi:hypothetical protein
LGLEPGNKLDFRVTGPGLMEVTVRAGTVAGLFGVVPAHGKRLAAEDMGDAIGRAAAEAYLEATA